MTDRDPNGYPVSPVDEIMRRNAEGVMDSPLPDTSHYDPAPTLTRAVISACVVGLLAILMLAIGGCGGKVEVDITEDPPIIRYIKEFCEAPPQDRFQDLLRLNQAVEGVGAFAMACPDTDIVQMSFQEGEYLGFPASRIFADYYYFHEDHGPVSLASRSESGKPPVPDHPTMRDD